MTISAYKVDPGTTSWRYDVDVESIHMGFHTTNIVCTLGA